MLIHLYEKHLTTFRYNIATVIQSDRSCHGLVDMDFSNISTAIIATMNLLVTILILMELNLSGDLQKIRLLEFLYS